MKLFKLYKENDTTEIIAATSKRKINKKGVKFIDDVSALAAGINDDIQNLMIDNHFTAEQIKYVMACLEQ